MVCKRCGKEAVSTGRFCVDCGSEFSREGETAAQVQDPLIGVTIEGKYRLDAKIGAGGMASVYRGTRLLIGDSVAVKILHAEQLRDPQAAERFRREAQAAARLKHPNAVSIYDFGVSSGGVIYLVMELVDGASLRRLIRDQGPFMPSAAADIMRQVCAALDEAHRQNIVHRDVKPDNIVVTITPEGVRVKVLDFGIARLRDLTNVGNLTQTGSVMGTPHYMSPEQCLGEELDGRSDIYSLGIVLYEMLAGVVPFNSPTSMAVVVQHVNSTPASLRILNVSVPPAVEGVVMKALEKRRESRQQTAQELGDDLTAAVAAGVAPARSAATAATSYPVLQTVQMATPFGTPAAAQQSGSVRRQTGSRMPDWGSRRTWATVVGACLIAATVTATVMLTRRGSPTTDDVRARASEAAAVQPIPRDAPASPATSPATPATQTKPEVTSFPVARDDSGAGAQPLPSTSFNAPQGATVLKGNGRPAVSIKATPLGPPQNHVDPTPQFSILNLSASEPGASFEVDGMGHSADEVTRLQLAPGRHVVSARKAGFTPASTEIEAEPGAIAKASLTLTPESSDAIVAQAESHYRSGAYEKAIETSRSALLRNPDQPKANLVMAQSSYRLKQFAESIPYFTRAITGGQEVTLPTKHHHAGFPSDGLCEGLVTIGKTRVAFRSTSMGGHDFDVPISQILEVKNEPEKQSRVHVKVSVPKGEKTDRKDYNFQNVGASLFNRSRSNVAMYSVRCLGCDDSMNVLFTLLQLVRSHSGD
jgi:tRNA A-37 threonylcarbamoyl transferase component Bud32